MDKFNEYVLLLNLPCPFTETELKRQYKYKLLKHHPDKNMENQDVATEKTKDINEAYTFLQTFVDSNNINNNNKSNNSDLNKNSDFANNSNNTSYNNMNDEDQEYMSSSIGSEYWNIWNDFLYNYLETHWKVDEMSNGNDENAPNQEKIFAICSKFIKSISLDYDNISTKCKDALCMLDKKATKTMIDLIFSYSSLTKFPVNIASEVKESLRTVAEDVHNIVIISPTLKDLFEDNVYVYEKDNEKYFVPLWHHEVVYNIPSSEDDNIELTVKCSPDLPDHITIDEENNIHIEVLWNSSHLLSSDSENIEYSIENKTFTISMQRIVLKKQQKIVLPKSGISTIDPADIYNNSNKSDIIFHVSLT